MTEMIVGVRELKTRLSAYMREVKTEATLTVTERGKPIARIVPLSRSPETRVKELAQAGFVTWSGPKLVPREPGAQTRGNKTVADLLLEGRDST